MSYVPKRFGGKITGMTTIRDVAKRLNISITTVSRAMDGYPDVAKDTRELVSKTAREMGYSPNRAARQLRRQKAETIGFIIPASTQRFDEPFFIEFISGLGEELSAKNFDLLIANATSDEVEHSLYQRWVSSHKVDGFVLNRMHRQDWRVQYLNQTKTPFVSMGKSHDDIRYPCTRIDGSNGYVKLINHLLTRGFSRFAYIGGIIELTAHIDRFQWFRSGLEVHHIPFDEANIISADMTSTGGYEAAKSLLSLAVEPDAILCVNDETAFGALHAAHEHGLVIGKELAIAGFDGVRDSIHTEPPLTTLDIPVLEIARQLVQMLLRIVDGETLEQSEITFQPKLLIRASTAGYPM
jgi:LacI family transcriptional regulator